MGSGAHRRDDFGGGARVFLVFHGWSPEDCPGNCSDSDEEAVAMPAKWLPGRETTPPQSLFYLIITRLGDLGRQGPLSKLRGREGSWRSFLQSFCKISGLAGSWGVELASLEVPQKSGSSGRGS